MPYWHSTPPSHSCLTQTASHCSAPIRNAVWGHQQAQIKVLSSKYKTNIFVVDELVACIQQWCGNVFLPSQTWHLEFMFSLQHIVSQVLSLPTTIHNRHLYISSTQPILRVSHAAPQTFLFPSSNVLSPAFIWSLAWPFCRYLHQ